MEIRIKDKIENVRDTAEEAFEDVKDTLIVVGGGVLYTLLCVGTVVGSYKLTKAACKAALKESSK